MSTLIYSQLTSMRDEAQPNTSFSTSPPGMKSYVDVLAALVPAEVLTLHGLMLSATTKIEQTQTIITAPMSLFGGFVGLLVVSMGLYAVPRYLTKKWDKLDWARIWIPPLALIGWAMLQRATAFDALAIVLKFGVSDATRTVIALLLAVVLAGTATGLAYKADNRKPTP